MLDLDKGRAETRMTGRKLRTVYVSTSIQVVPCRSSNISILLCCSSVLMVYFRCLIVVFFVHVFDIPLDAAALSFVLRNDGEACQEFLILPTDKKGVGERRGREKRRKLKIAETASEARKQKQDGKGKKRLQDIILFSLSFTHPFPVTGTIFVILPTGNRNGVKKKDRMMACF